MSLIALMLSNKENDAKMESGRKSNIELLRIIAMCGVVILHYNNTSFGGGLLYAPHESLNRIILYGLEGLFICAVDLFILITGFFGCLSQKRSPVKVVTLLIQVSMFRLLGSLYDYFCGEQISIGGLIGDLLPVNYFVILYVTLYLISPFINILLGRLSKKTINSFCYTFYFSVFALANYC